MIAWSACACAMMLPLGKPMLSLFNHNPHVIKVGFAHVHSREPFY